MRETQVRLAEEYTSALEDYLHGAGENALQQAYELGRRALADGLGVLEMAALYHEALLGVLRRPTTLEETLQQARSAGTFFTESLSPFEVTHRGYREGNLALRRLNEILEEEARRIAHALHDEAGQLLASLHITLDVAARELPPQSREHLTPVKSALDQTEENIRRLSHELRPTILDDLGLIPALEFLARGVSARTGLSVDVQGPAGRRFSPSAEIALYRSVQEALNNVAKHAQARRVSIQVQAHDATLKCSIRDDGVGFDPAALACQKGASGLGLLGIRERVSTLGGMITINSRPGQGTELVLTIPIPKGS